LLSSGFINFDDTDYVTENVHVLKGLNGQSITWAFTTTEAANWHPLTWLSHMLDVQLFGLDAGKHHLTSLLLHILNSVLLFLLLVRMTGALWRSAFVAALFAIHPLHVESVAWIAERKDVLSTLFWLLTLGAWLGYVKSKKAAPYVLALALYALGLMAKPMLVTLPFTLLLLDYWPLRRLAIPLHRRIGALKILLWEKLPFFMMSAASCIITFVAQRNQGAVETLENLVFGGRIANAAVAYVSYLGKTFWPASLAVYYPHPRTDLITWPVAGSALLLAGATILLLRLGRKAPFLLFGWLWYLGTLVPVIGLVQVGGQAMADRYTYVPLIGVFIAIAWGLAELALKIPGARVVAPVIAVASLAALFPIARAQTGHWTDTAALFEHTLAVTSDNLWAHNIIGFLRFDQGNIDEAITHYMEALRINSNFVEAQINLGNALADTGRYDEAIKYCNQALLRVGPENYKALNNLGRLLAKVNRIPEAIECLQKAIKIKPDFAEAHNNLGAVLGRQNRMPEAIEHFMEAVRIKPDYAQGLDNLGMALQKTNRLPEAIERFRQAVRIAPNSAKIHYNLGMALAIERRLTEAQEQFQEALRINPDYENARAGLQDVRKTLGLAQ